MKFRKCRWLTGLLLAVLGLWGCTDGAKTTHSSEPVQSVRMRVLSFNMHHGRGGDDRINLERIAGVILDSGADLVALQEVDVKTQRSGGIDQLAELKRLTGMAGVFGKGRDFEGGDYGQAILSRFPIKSSEVHHLQGSLPGDVDLRIALSAQIDGPLTGTVTQFVTTHLHHQDEAHRMVQATRLMQIFNAQATSSSLIVAGDFNAEPEATVIALLNTRFQDSTPPDALTYPTDKPVKKLDYIFASQTGPWKLLESRVIPEMAASDHRPVVADFEVFSR